MTTFVAMLWRDAHVARRNFIQLAFQTLMQPMMFVFVFGRVMTTSGFMPPGKSRCCCRASSPSAW